MYPVIDRKENDEKNFVLPILYLHPDEKIKPIEPAEYLKTVDLWNDITGQCISQKITFQTLSDNKANPAMDLRSKYANPKAFWQTYKYSDPSTIPLYHTEEAKQLINPKTNKKATYIERNFNTFYGYNIGSWSGIGDHEADIEDFVIHYDLNGNPLRIFAGCHRAVDGEWRNFRDIHLDGKTGRPVLYVSKGDHGLYFEPKSHTRFCCCANDDTAEGIRWDPPASILMNHAEPSYDWLNYQGGWGNGHVSSPNISVDPEIYWNSNTTYRRFFGCGNLTAFNPYD